MKQAVLLEDSAHQGAQGQVFVVRWRKKHLSILKDHKCNISTAVTELWPLRNHLPTTGCICNGRSICDITHWFVDCCFEASGLDFGRRHLGFWEPEVTIFGREGDAKLVFHNGRQS